MRDVRRTAIASHRVDETKCLAFVRAERSNPSSLPERSVAGVELIASSGDTARAFAFDA